MCLFYRQVPFPIGYLPKVLGPETRRGEKDSNLHNFSCEKCVCDSDDWMPWRAVRELNPKLLVRAAGGSHMGSEGQHWKER